jgi:8-oxo-dGTP diphosphatase
MGRIGNHAFHQEARMTREYPAYPLPAIGVILWRGEQTLLIRRGKPPGQGEWGLIGGVQETGETHFEAAIREAKEETGLTIAPFAIVTAIDGITRDADGRVQFHYSIVEVNAEWVAGEAVAASDAAETRWIALPELRQMPVWSELLRVVELAYRQRKTG